MTHQHATRLRTVLTLLDCYGPSDYEHLRKLAANSVPRSVLPKVVRDLERGGLVRSSGFVTRWRGRGKRWEAVK